MLKWDSKTPSDKQLEMIRKDGTATATTTATNEQRVQTIDDCSESDLESIAEADTHNQQSNNSNNNNARSGMDTRIQPTTTARDQVSEKQNPQEGAPSSPPLSFLNSPPPSTLHSKGQRQIDERAPRSKQLLRKSSEFFHKVIKIKTSPPPSKERDAADNNAEVVATPVSSFLSHTDSSAIETSAAAVPVIRQYPPKPLQYSAAVHPPSDDPKRFSLPATHVQPSFDTGSRRKSAYFESVRIEPKRRSILRHFRFNK